MKFFIKSSLIFLLLSVSVNVYGHEEDDEKLKVDVGADLVSSYVWRGFYLAGASVQPSISLSAFGVTLEA